MSTIRVTHAGAVCEPIAGKPHAEDMPANNGCAICKGARSAPSYLGATFGPAFEAIRAGNESVLRNVIRTAAGFGWAEGMVYATAEAARDDAPRGLPLCPQHLGLMKGLVAARQAADALRDMGRSVAAKKPPKKREVH